MLNKELPNPFFDVIIVGGGLVGLTTSLLLAHNGFSIALVERGNFKKIISMDCEWEGFDNRVFAINRASETVLRAAGVWDSIANERISPYRTMTVWDALGFGELSFDAADIAEPNLGHIIENRVMMKVLSQEVLSYPNIHLFLERKALSIQREDKSVVLALEHGETLETLRGRLMIGGDGGHSWVRTQMTMPTAVRSYHQEALVATVVTEEPHQETAWQRFLPDGPIAFLPLSNPCTASLVWTSTEAHIKRLLLMSEEEFCQELSHHFDYRLGKVTNAKDRQAFPLNSIHAKKTVEERVALIGDAAHVIHPLAGQGVNLGFLDAAVLCEVLREAHQSRYDIGSYPVLRRYERARKTDVKLMIGLMDFFKQVFGIKLSWFAGLRSLGMNLTHKHSWIKNEILKRAMGLNVQNLKGDLPLNVTRV